MGNAFVFNVEYNVERQILASANQTTRYQFTPGGMTITKRQETTGINDDVERREPLCTLGGNING